MAAEGNPNIKINGSVRLVGDVPSVAGSSRTTAMPNEMGTNFAETTTMMSTTTTRKHRSSTVQVEAKLLSAKPKTFDTTAVTGAYGLCAGKKWSNLYGPLRWLVQNSKVADCSVSP